MYIVNCYYNMYYDVCTCTSYIISYNYTLCTTTRKCLHACNQTREGVVRIDKTFAKYVPYKHYLKTQHCIIQPTKSHMIYVHKNNSKPTCLVWGFAPNTCTLHVLYK